MTLRPSEDEKMLHQGQYHALGFLGPVSSVFTLAWLATHRNRLRTLLFGFKRLSVLIVYDTKAGELVPHDDAEIAALKTIVYGPEK